MKDCNQCGKCCIKYGDGRLSASASEIDYWENYRPDIYRFVKDDNIWFDPDTGEALTKCPWLRKAADSKKYTCDIYLDRPNDCQYYPVNINEMVIDECEMLETQDLIRPKLAQKRLDEIMIDSRPAYE